ncbi:MAG: penicillin-binding protein activator [Syntrophobacteraceae bacterium]|nr:penicillin-binding protein activator [Syntrophobacteraceae bacterium]
MGAYKKGGWFFCLVILTILTGCAGGGKQTPPNLSASFTTVTPPDAQRLYREAEKSYRAGDTPGAMDVWHKIVRGYPGTAIAARSMNKMGEVYLAEDRLDLAARYFNYIVYEYPSWEGVRAARLNQLKVLARMGKQKEVMREAVPLFRDSQGHPGVRLGLAKLMVGIYNGRNDIETSFEWSSRGFSSAKTAEQKQTLSDLTKQTLARAGEGDLKKLYGKKPGDFMRVFLDFRRAQIEAANGQKEKARRELAQDLSQNPGHPLAQDIQAVIRSVGVVEGGIAFNADKIGVMVPLKGTNSVYGDMVIRGLNLAMADWRNTHPNDNITLDIKDAGLDPDTAARSYNELVKKDGVMAIVGPLGAQANRTVIPLANRQGVPMLSLTQKDEGTGSDTFVLHAFIDSRDLVNTLVRYCREKLNFKRFACLYPDDRYGQKLSKIFAEAVQKSGGQMMASASYTEKSTDFSAALKALMDISKKNAPLESIEGTPFDALFIPDQVSTLSLIAPQLPYNNIVGATLVGTNLWSEPSLVQAGGVYVDHALFATSFYPQSQNPKVVAFEKEYEAQYHAAPTYLEAQAYDALTLLLEARSGQGGEVNRNALFQSLLEQAKNFEGVTGNYSVGPGGDLVRQYSVFQVKNGSIEQVYP